MSTSLLETGTPERIITPLQVVTSTLLVGLVVTLAGYLETPRDDTELAYSLLGLAILLAGPLAGARASALGVGVYLCAGAAGLPVFPGDTAGLGQLHGPHAGALWCAVLIPIPLAHLARRIDGGRSGPWLLAFIAAQLLLHVVDLFWTAMSTASWSLWPLIVAYIPGVMLNSMLAVGVMRFIPSHFTRSKAPRPRREALEEESE